MCIRDRTRLSSDQITAILERSLLDNSKVAELNLFGVDLIDINTDLLARSIMGKENNELLEARHMF